MDAEESITLNGIQQSKDEMKWNHKKKFLMFCEVVLQHERELLSETLNSSQESINENRAPEEGQNNDSIENSTFNSDSDGANGETMAAYTNAGGGGEDGDSFNSVTCFCGKPFAGRPMIECSGCLTWLHMSCAKVKRKNIPEFYYCDNCKGRGLLSPGITTASSGEDQPQHNNNGTALSSTNGESIAAKPRKPKIKSSSSSSELNIIKNSDSSKKSMSSGVNGKLKKIRGGVTPKKSTKAYASSSLAAAASLTELSLNHQQVELVTNNNNNIYSSMLESQQIIDSENGRESPDKYNSKRVKLL